MTRLYWYFDRPLIREADAARDRRQWPEAATLYRRILDRRPQRKGVWVQYAHMLMKLEHPVEALAAYREADRLDPGNADTLYHLAVSLRETGAIEEAGKIFEQVIGLNPERHELIRGAIGYRAKKNEIPESLNYVFIGTTGTCNASCVHCPTGKLETAHVPRTPMPMPLFRKIIDEIADSGMEITGQVAFGLFGDALADPYVVERARYLREKLPNAVLSINSNGAAYNPKKHAVLNDYASIFGLHCESLVPETYDYLMQPLRAERVHVKFPMIFRDFPGKVYVAVPLSKPNIDERPAMEEYFYGHGAIAVEFTPMSNRCAEDDGLFDKLSFGSVPIRCETDIFYNLVVDCDGTVLACCNDFRRIESVGNLATDSLAETLAHQKRLGMRRKLAAGEHDDISTCRRCRGDLPESIPPLKTRELTTA